MRMLALLAAGLFAGSLLAADDKKDDKKAKDEDAIVGVWKVEKFDAGREGGPSAEDLAKVRMTFKKDGTMVTREPDGMEKEGKFKLDPSAKPKAIDVTADKREVAGVYELSGDTLTLALPAGESKTRPTELKADGKGIVVITLKRTKDEKKEEKDK